MPKKDLPKDFDLTSVDDWYWFFISYNIPNEFIEKHYTHLTVDNRVYYLVDNCKLDESILDRIVQDKNTCYFIWDHIFLYQDISQEYLEKHLNSTKCHKLNLGGYASSHVKFSLDFILKHKDKLNVNGLSINNKIELPLAFLYENFKDKVNVSGLKERTDYELKIEDKLGKLKDVYPYLQLLPKRKGKFYRGIRFYCDSTAYNNFVQQHKPGTVIEVDSISSTSINKKVAEAFARMEIVDSYNKSILMEIDGEALLNGDNKYSEREYLLLRGTKLKIKDVAEVEHENFKNKKFLHVKYEVVKDDKKEEKVKKTKKVCKK